VSRAVARRRSGLAHTVAVDGHELVTDELAEDGGNDEGPRPTHLLAASLASCTATTMKLYASRKQWDIDGVVISVDFAGTPPRGEKPEFAITVELPPGLDEEQRSRLMVIAGKCPVHRMLVAGAEITLEPASGAA
jgi:putative redox protein